jgi:hypothetical protein
VDRKAVFRRLWGTLGILGLLLILVPASMIHEGPGRFVLVKVGLGVVVAAVVCGLLSLSGSSGAGSAPPPTAYRLALVSVLIPPVSFAASVFQYVSLALSFVLVVIAFGRAILELAYRKQWRLFLPWLALAVCLTWPLVVKVSPCFVVDRLTREIEAMDGKKCYERL